MFGFLFIISDLLFSKFFVSKIIQFILEKILEMLIFISQVGSKLPLNKLYLATPDIWQIVALYLLIFIANIMYKIINKRKRTTFEKRLINWKNLIKHLIRKNSRKVIIVIVAIIITFFVIKIAPTDLKIHFVNVGQGDCTLIITPKNKTILIDGGGSETYNVGENILLPYLLDRKIIKIDYMFISHFDTDHVRTVYYM